MSMRVGRVEDYWRRAFQRPYAARYENLTYENLFCLGKGEITFRGGITAIIGGNGVGKSTLAMAIGELVDRELLVGVAEGASRLVGSSLRGRVVLDQSTRIRRAEDGQNGQRKVEGDNVLVDCRWVDTAYIAFHIKAQIARDQNFQDLLEPLGPSVLSHDELDLLSYLVGKHYEHCEIFEIPDYAGFERFPYYKARASGVSYGSEGMGQGELSLLLIFSVLRDVSQNSILILEEPETHVSPRSQAALMNVVAKYCAEKGIWTIITTHSPTILSRLEAEHIRLLVKDGPGVTIIDEPSRFQLAAVMGGAEGFRGVLLVEDAVAKEVLIALLDEVSPDLLRQFEIVPAGSDGELSAALKSFPKTGKWLTIVGIYDGDMKGKIEAAKFYWPHLFLPMERSPELTIRAVALHNQADRVADLVGKNRNVILTALEATAGMDAHDWLIECARHVGMNRADFVRLLTRLWLSESRAVAQAFVNDLVTCYNAAA